MKLPQKETIILNLIAQIFEQIIQDNLTLSIRAKSRAGAEISDFLEDKFVEIAENKEGVIKVGGAPKGQTKSPFDIYLIYEFYPTEKELIWIDIKATNVVYSNSNPDMGTYKKFLDFFKQGHYFAFYCHFAYLPEGEGLKFVNTPQGELFNLFLLKDIHHSFRIQPNNQLQVNYAAPPEPRSLIDFINLLQTKLQESLIRRQKIIERELNKLDNEFEEIKQTVRKSLSREFHD
ncbi:MAG: hypothetical protein Fur006_31260 [Coleofasciculaceae cyanobacterium]